MKEPKNFTEFRDDWFEFAIVRDPLERFASWWIDKCQRRGNGQHCQPREIFWKNVTVSGNLDYYNKTQYHPLETMTRRELFATYVGTFPLTWNVHFIPQIHFCDLKNLEHK